MTEQRSSVQSFIQVLSKSIVLMHINLLHATVQMGVLRFTVFVFIITTVTLHMLDPSLSTLLSPLWIDLLPGFCMSVIISRIKIHPFINDYMLVQHPIIYTGLKNIAQMFLSMYWRSILYSIHECNTENKTIQTKMESTSWCIGCNSII